MKTDVKRVGRFTSAAMIGGKGRITIPQAIRSALRVEAGDRVEFIEIAPGRYELVGVTQSVTALKGMFGRSARTVSIEEMNAFIVRSVVAEKLSI